MTQHPIYLSEAIYQLLAKRAGEESKSLEQIAERLLAQELAPSRELSNGQQVSHVPENADEALAAVYRLTNLFADVKVGWLEQTLDDPMLELSNADLEIDWL